MKISISVPKPCHENWNAMSPAADPTTGIDGRHCDSCQHTVMDLTRVSDAQLIDLFRRDAMPKCARFSQGQLDRVIAMEERTPRLLAAAAVGAALALASPDADAQSRPAPGCTPTLGKMAVTAPAPVVDFQTVGAFVVLDPAPVVKGEMGVVPVDTADQIIETVRMGQAIVPVQVDVDVIITGDTVVTQPIEGPLQIRGGRAEVVYYIDGVKVPAGSDLGMPTNATEEVQVITGGIPCTFGDVGQQPTTQPFVAQHDDNTCVYDDKAPLTGRVVHAGGVGAAGATVELVEAEVICITDVNGYFSFDATAIADLRKITVAVRVAGEERTKSIGSDLLPCSLPFTLDSAAPAQVINKDEIDLGDAVMDQHFMPMVGLMAIEVLEPGPASIGQHIAAPFRWLGRQVSKPFR